MDEYGLAVINLAVKDVTTFLTFVETYLNLTSPTRLTGNVNLHHY